MKYLIITILAMVIVLVSSSPFAQSITNNQIQSFQQEKNHINQTAMLVLGG